MRAIVYETYGPPEVLALRELDRPAVQDNEVLVRVHAASANPLDWHYMRGKPYIMRASAGLLRPKDTRMGVDVAGRVEAVGRGVTRLRPGDEVFGTGRGSFAEYVIASERTLAHKPANLSFAQAAAVPIAAFTAIQGLRDQGGIAAGQQVLVVGASGGVGTFAVQIAKAIGAEVTGVCSTRNVELVRSIGAGHVIDYTREDFTRAGRQYDLIFDTAGSYPLRDCLRALRPAGAYVIVGGPDGRWIGPLARLLRAMLLGRFVKQRLMPLLATQRQEDLAFMQPLLESGAVVPVIDRCYPLDQAAEAIRYLETGRARGKVIITI